MSGSGKSAKPVRQLSLQPPTPKRQQIRRQRSAEDDKSLQISASPLARGKRGTSGKPAFERPKVRVAWSENRRKNEKDLEQVEVVARQIPGRSKPTAGKLRGFVGVEKPTILYSRQELAERLRLAWKQREENKANINIFLAHGTVEKRCDSEVSARSTIATPSLPLSRNDEKLEIPLADDCNVKRDGRRPETSMRLDEYYLEKKENSTTKKSSTIPLGDDGRDISKKDEVSSDFEYSYSEMERIEASEEHEASRTGKRGESSFENAQQPLRSSVVDEGFSNSKKKPSMTIDRSNPRDSSSTLPLIKAENSTMDAGKSKEDLSSAKQKRASFHSGTNLAFLGPIMSPTEFGCGPVAEKAVQQKLGTEFKSASEGKDSSIGKTVGDKLGPRNALEMKCGSTNIVQKTAADSKLNSTTEKSTRARAATENRDASVDNKQTTQKTSNGDKVASTTRRIASGSTLENKDGSTVEKIASTRNTFEARCSSVIERNPLLKKPVETLKVDQKSRRTSSAPPQRHLGNASNNRVQVNIVIDAPNVLSSGKSSDRDKPVEIKDSSVERTNTTKSQVSSGRSVRSAPLRRRSKSAKRRFWGKNDEDGKSRNRSTGRGRNSIDFKAIDIVTMVSLVSSADSDSDIENSPVDDKLIDELRSKLPTTSIIKTSTNSTVNIARKPVKSVSFQRDSFEEDPPKEQQPPPREERKTTTSRLAIVNHRENGGSSPSEETLHWRTDLALPVLTLIHNAEETVDVPLTDREKRCLAVPIGDLHDKKRKLLKTRSATSQSGMEKQAISSKTKTQESPRIVPQRKEARAQQLKTPANSLPTDVKFVATSKETAQQVQPMLTEPQFQTNKEKECWHLYRKMCDKGVCVSFDTVLRGMLTPTEYRLRQRELFQDL